MLGHIQWLYKKDGKILAGSSSIGVAEVMILVRYNINGSLDTSLITPVF
ncbi:MAG: delta-60 repeat domain-containing protein [Saprospiraceae bacterium]|nr:delta-60 repeat domain-containing protein [Candidatus Defluviibacterium haderslevense]